MFYLMTTVLDSSPTTLLHVLCSQDVSNNLQVPRQASLCTWTHVPSAWNAHFSIVFLVDKTSFFERHSFCETFPWASPLSKNNNMFFVCLFKRQCLALLSRLECSGTIIALCRPEENICSSDPPAPVSWVPRTTGACHHTWLFYFL